MMVPSLDAHGADPHPILPAVDRAAVLEIPVLTGQRRPVRIVQQRHRRCGEDVGDQPARQGVGVQAGAFEYLTTGDQQPQVAVEHQDAHPGQVVDQFPVPQFAVGAGGLVRQGRGDITQLHQERTLPSGRVTASTRIIACNRLPEADLITTAVPDGPARRPPTPSSPGRRRRRGRRCGNRGPTARAGRRHPASPRPRRSRSGSFPAGSIRIIASADRSKATPRKPAGHHPTPAATDGSALHPTNDESPQPPVVHPPRPRGPPPARASQG